MAGSPCRGQWETWERSSPWGGGSFGVASCSYAGRPDREPAARPTTRGSSRFVSRSGASATLVVTRYADAEVAASGSGLAVTVPETCGTTTTYVVDGVQVRHDSMPSEGDSVDDMWMGDVWSARIGADRAHLEVINDAGVADDATAEEVAEALVAGLRDGWTQSGMKEVAPEDQLASPLPEWTDVDLEGAFAGWRSPTRRAATTSPNLLCLHDRLDGSTAGVAAGGSRWGLSYRVAGYLDPADARANVDLVLDELRACTSSAVELETLPGGVHLATYDTGGPEPFNALWIVAEGDRAAMVAVERADHPLPQGVPDDVADAMLEILRKPWR